VHADIAGEDVATILLQMKNGANVPVKMAWGKLPENDPSPDHDVH
jgi:hypothetical protein